MPISIYFHVEHIYYLPQFLPVLKELKKRGCQCVCFFNLSINQAIIDHASVEHDLQFETFDSEDDALLHYINKKPNWVIFGNHFKPIHQLHHTTKTAMLYHGIGIKECYYDKDLNNMDIRFVEGEYRANEINKRQPEAKIATTGFAKLDPLFNANGIYHLPENLDNNKKTILYAPTFYPSTIENIPASWPADFSEFNLIIKPHEFSLSNKKYNEQRKRINEWAQFDNVYLAKSEEFSLLPFMQCADILISEASSALFEFAALNKPIIWCDFIKLRWNYRGIFSYRYKKRMDLNIMKYNHIATHAPSYKNLLSTVHNELSNPGLRSAERKKITHQVLGNVDGKVALRVCDYLLAKASS